MGSSWPRPSWREIRVPLQDVLLAASLAVTLAGTVVLVTFQNHRAMGAEGLSSEEISSGLPDDLNSLCLGQPPKRL